MYHNHCVMTTSWQHCVTTTVWWPLSDDHCVTTRPLCDHFATTMGPLCKHCATTVRPLCHIYQQYCQWKDDFAYNWRQTTMTNSLAIWGLNVLVRIYESWNPSEFHIWISLCLNFIHQIWICLCSNFLHQIWFCLTLKTHKFWVQLENINLYFQSSMCFLL